MHSPKVRTNELKSQPLRTFYMQNVRMAVLSERLKIAMSETSPPMRGADLCRAIKISKATMSDWLSGKTKYIRGENLVKAAKALNVTPEWLANGTLPMRPNYQKTLPYAVYQVSENKDPVHIETKSIPAEAFLRVRHIIDNGIGAERFNNWTEEEQKHIVNLLQTILLDKESKDLSDDFILKMVHLNEQG